MASQASEDVVDEDAHVVGMARHGRKGVHGAAAGGEEIDRSDPAVDMAMQIVGMSSGVFSVAPSVRWLRSESRGL